MKKLFFAALATAILSSSIDASAKYLILYYSQTGATEKVAYELQKQTGADIERFDVENKYDGDFGATIQRVEAERREGFLPAINPIESDLSQYDVIFLAYPIWFGTYPPPVQALIQSYKFEGKTIIPVCTFGSGGLEASVSDLLKALSQATIVEGFGIRNARVQYAEEELNLFLIGNGYKEGQIDPLPDYSEQDDVSPEELAIYNEATSDYQFPMGEPVSVGRRVVPEGMDYVYTVRSSGPFGPASQGKVFVVTRTGRKAEFTKAVR